MFFMVPNSFICFTIDSYGVLRMGGRTSRSLGSPFFQHPPHLKPRRAHSRCSANVRYCPWGAADDQALRERYRQEVHPGREPAPS